MERERRIVPLVLKVTGLVVGLGSAILDFAPVLAGGRDLLSFAVRIVPAIASAALLYGAGILLELLIDMAENVRATRVYLEVYLESLVEEDDKEEIENEAPEKTIGSTGVA